MISKVVIIPNIKDMTNKEASNGWLVLTTLRNCCKA